MEPSILERSCGLGVGVEVAGGHVFAPHENLAVGRDHHLDAGDGFADNQLAVLEYPKATVTVRSALTEVEGGVRRQFVVVGTKGTFDIRPLEPPSARLALDTARGEWKRGYQDVTFPRPAGRYDGDFADLARVIRGEKALAFTPEHDLAVQETVLLASGMPLG